VALQPSTVQGVQRETRTELLKKSNKVLKCWYKMAGALVIVSWKPWVLSFEVFDIIRSSGSLIFWCFFSECQNWQLSDAEISKKTWTGQFFWFWNIRKTEPSLEVRYEFKIIAQHCQGHHFLKVKRLSSRKGKGVSH
jgi:hypothetical protein